VTESALVSHYFAGFGNPLDLPIDLFLILLGRIGYVQQLTGGSTMSDRDYVEFVAEADSFED